MANPSNPNDITQRIFNGTQTDDMEDLQSSSHKTILVLASSPTNEARLRLDKEMREIDEGLRRSQHRDKFTF